jgi:hypothetical protein
MQTYGLVNGWPEPRPNGEVVGAYQTRTPFACKSV